MSMPTKYPLYDFIATVPSCAETTTLAVVLEIFAQEQCDAIAVLNKQQCPLGLLTSTRLLPQLLQKAQGEQSLKFLDLQQPISKLGQALIQPIQSLPADWDVEQFGLFLRSPNNQTNTNQDWGLIDKTGKFLGIVDSSRLLQFLAKQRLELDSCNCEQRQKSNPLVQLLERLPWPLMLQTATGEIITQNQAWWQQLGALKDPEGVRRQVEAILATPSAKSQYPTQTAVKHLNGNGNGHKSEDNNWSVLMASTEARNLQDQSLQEAASNQCFLDSQLGTCTCIVEVQNGQERVWQFAKIPLDSPELKVQSGESIKTRALSTNLWLMLATDVTEQQQLCKELAAKNADLIQLNRLKDEFLACISHELKTPLTAVLGLSRLLVDRQLGELNERQARYAGLIHQSGRHLMSVVNDILDLTRMETGQMELTLSNVKIGAVCDRAVSEAKAIHSQTSRSSINTNQASPSREHQFTLSIEPGLDQFVADELRLRQMLVHLLSNAFKFTETGGEIGLAVSRWEGWITFTIWDTGIGIPEHQQHLIFQKFQQLENPLTRQYEGTGLGLVLTRALARLHGGDVSFLSQEGKGSQFTLLLPPNPPKEVGRLGDGVGRTSLSPRPTDSSRLGRNPRTQVSGPTPLPKDPQPMIAQLTVSGSRRQSLQRLEPDVPKVANQPSDNWHASVRTNPNASCNKSGSPTPVPSTVLTRATDWLTPVPSPSKDATRTTEETSATDWLANSLAPSWEPQAPHHPTSSKSLVLVVEAVARYIEELSEQLTGLGYRVVVARSGCEAVEKARRLQPKAIFLNPLLPLLSGWDVLTLLKSDPATCHISVMMTATAAEKEQAFANGADGFLSLPVQHQVLAPLLENLSAAPSAKQHKLDGDETTTSNTPLRILRLVNPECVSQSHPLLKEHRVIEVDDLEQAELLSQVWQFDVILLDAEMPAAEVYLQQLSQYPRLAAIPLVTCNVANTQTASQVAGLSVFPCLTPLATDNSSGGGKTDTLLSVLQIASGVCCPPNILVVDLTILPDLPEVRHKQVRGYRSEKNSTVSSVTQEDVSCPLQGLKPLTISRGSEWFQALIQYLQTAGFKAVMGRSWAELLQQIRHQSVDLLLICLGTTMQKEVYSALKALGQLPFDLPPVLLLDQRLNPTDPQEGTQQTSPLESIENVVGAIATQILPRSISMEELLNQINQALKSC